MLGCFFKANGKGVDYGFICGLFFWIGDRFLVERMMYCLEDLLKRKTLRREVHI